MNFYILTLFPEMVMDVLNTSIIGRAVKNGLFSIEDVNIRDFEHVARKYGVDFALKKDRSGDYPRYLVFFKARDGDALTAAFREFCARSDRAKKNPSIVQTLRRMRAQEANREAPRTRKKELETR